MAYTYLDWQQCYKRPGPDKNLRRGNAEIVYCEVRGGWILPGGVKTKDREKASQCLERMAGLMK